MLISSLTFFVARLIHFEQMEHLGSSRLTQSPKETHERRGCVGSAHMAALSILLGGVTNGRAELQSPSVLCT